MTTVKPWIPAPIVEGVRGIEPFPVFSIMVVGDLERYWEFAEPTKRLGHGSGLSVAGVGELASVSLGNPPTSGVLIVVYSVIGALEVTGNVQLRVDVEIGSAQGTTAWLDRRLPANPVAAVRQLSTPGAQGTLVVTRRAVLNENHEFVVRPMVLPPGERVVVTAATINVDVTADFVWEEMELARRR